MSGNNGSGIITAGSSDKDAQSTFKIPVSNSRHAVSTSGPVPVPAASGSAAAQAAAAAQHSPRQEAPLVAKSTPPSTPPFQDQSPAATSMTNTHSSTSGHRRRLSVDNQALLIPKTPDHQNLNNGFENTPLQSPTKTPRSVKRRSTDVYNLLKTPDYKLHRVGHGTAFEDEAYDDEKISRQAKRSSLELYKLLNTEDNKIKLVQKSPVQGSTSVFNDNPTSPGKNTYRVKKSDADIKELSNNLKSRLNYAFLKVQHGMNDKPVSSDLEKSPLKAAMTTSTSVARDAPITRPRPLSLHSTNVSGSAAAHSFSNNRIRLDDFASSRSNRRRNSVSSHVSTASTTNANEALFTALSPKQPSSHHYLKQQHEQDPEKTAAMSLMKLSSPIKQSATINFPSNSAQSSPTKRAHFTGQSVQQPDEEDNKTETDIDEDDIDMNHARTDDEFSE